MMHRLRHRRVVKLLGVIMEEGSYSLVMEYMEQGDLMRVLKAQVRLARPASPCASESCVNGWWFGFSQE